AAATIETHLSGILPVGHGRFAASANEIAGDRDLLARTLGATPQEKSAGAGAIKEVAGDVVAVTPYNLDAFAVPFDAVAGEGAGSVFFARGKTSAAIAREPVVQQKSVPTLQPHAISGVVPDHAMADGEAPGPYQPHAVTGEIGYA